MVKSRREQLVDTATDLFDREGFHATGIDRILAEAGVAKMTLYNHFRSKDELILAVLRRRDEMFRNHLVREVERRADTPAGRLTAVFDVVADAAAAAEFNGCIFAHAAAEFAGRNSAIVGACAEHKRLVRKYLVGLSTAAGAKDPVALGDQIAILVEGALAAAQVSGDVSSVRTAATAAGILIDYAVSAPRAA